MSERAPGIARLHRTSGGGQRPGRRRLHPPSESGPGTLTRTGQKATQADRKVPRRVASQDPTARCAFDLVDLDKGGCQGMTTAGDPYGDTGFCSVRTSRRGQVARPFRTTRPRRKNPLTPKPTSSQRGLNVGNRFRNRAEIRIFHLRRRPGRGMKRALSAGRLLADGVLQFAPAGDNHALHTDELPAVLSDSVELRGPLGCR
jgi:hypothetical protein